MTKRLTDEELAELEERATWARGCELAGAALPIASLDALIAEVRQAREEREKFAADVELANAVRVLARQTERKVAEDRRGYWYPLGIQLPIGLWRGLGLGWHDSFDEACRREAKAALEADPSLGAGHE